MFFAVNNFDSKQILMAFRNLVNTRISRCYATIPLQIAEALGGLWPLKGASGTSH